VRRSYCNCPLNSDKGLCTFINVSILCLFSLLKYSAGFGCWLTAAVSLLREGGICGLDWRNAGPFAQNPLNLHQIDASTNMKCNTGCNLFNAFVPMTRSLPIVFAVRKLVFVRMFAVRQIYAAAVRRQLGSHRSAPESTYLSERSTGPKLLCDRPPLEASVVV